ncbi:mitochondrial inner membrane protease subunit 2-like [Chenopodium quinoa]|uniref:mitochondrial inner membrane protease subunit 2-like n=1 Tax=Chenopodium quinoa TaxID=63459 RepID=UPI000B79487C|nr:mitochondrial inner membrane protease subunit 2-like [Chenopodium quinoa]XP_021741598.1 mitochondrial inner membrane protease subunit 2-like [Chenopodium quinoa]
MATPKYWWGVAKKCFTVGIISLTVSDQFGCISRISGHSMSPTFNPAHNKFKDYVLVEKFCLNKYDFSHGDVIIFLSPSNHKERHVKRIIAMPGDWLSLSDSHDTVKIPQGHCWVEGDDVASSADSRSYGPVPLGLAQGRVTHILWPPQRIGKVERVVPHHRLALS